MDGERWMLAVIVMRCREDVMFCPCHSVQDHVYVDAHILATPACIDINNDDIPDLVISVSYFFDENEFINHPHVRHVRDMSRHVRPPCAVSGAVSCHVVSCRVVRHSYRGRVMAGTHPSLVMFMM